MNTPEGSDRSGAAYRRAGVDLEEAQAALSRMVSPVKSTHTPRVVPRPGAYAGFFAYPDTGSDRLLVSSMDGVGTKMRVAALANRFVSVGYDIVSHCVNDILVHGARPLFFLDYIGAARLESRVVGELIDGMAEACRESGCALIGGETAEMPGVYSEGDWEVVGTIVGEVERDRVIDGRTIRPGDLVLGLKSHGLHTNGYSLARRAFGIDEDPARLMEALEPGGATVGDLLLERHRMYTPLITPLLEKGWVAGMAHLTGGGIPDNLPRILPAGTRAVVRRDAWEVPLLFRELCRRAQVGEDERYRVFNMGLGWLLVVSPEQKDRVASALEQAGERPLDVGWIEAGEKGVRWAEPGESTPRTSPAR